MEHKKLGIMLLAISLIFAAAIIIFKIQINNLTNEVMIATGGTCIENGKCLHEQSDLPMYIGTIITALTMALGAYLIFFEQARQHLEKQQKAIIQTLHQTKKKLDGDEKFDFLLKALNQDEQKIMKAVKEQDGIEQSTLMIRAGLSKAKLSMLLSDLEKKSLIAKVPFGKKNKIHLKNAL